MRITDVEFDPEAGRPEEVTVQSDNCAPLLAFINRPADKQTRFRTWLGNKLLKWAARAFRSDWSFWFGDASFTIKMENSGGDWVRDPSADSPYSATWLKPKHRTTIVIEDKDLLGDFDFAAFSKKWGADHKGAGRAHRVAVLEKGE